MRCRFLSLLPVLLLSSCMPQPTQGPPANLTEIARPDPLPSPAPAPDVRPASPPAVLPPSASRPEGPVGTFPVWVPRHRSSQGDETPGHWKHVSLTPPPQEAVEPAKPMPHMPLVSRPAKERESPRAPMPQVFPPVSQESAPPGSPQAFPPGMSPKIQEQYNEYLRRFTPGGGR